MRLSGPGDHGSGFCDPEFRMVVVGAVRVPVLGTQVVVVMPGGRICHCHCYCRRCLCRRCRSQPQR